MAVHIYVCICRMLLEDQARSGCVTLTVVRSPPDHKTKDKFDSVVVAPQSSQQQYSREEVSVFNRFK